MKIKGTIKLEISATEDEKEQVDKLIFDLENDPNLQFCKIKITTRKTAVRKIR